ncbi:ArsR/SmtB family transcription factor [Streptomyces monticola]|uniref:ArsR/SmtB family transcription factor n=1 Tax=Streptomyces monticola TaxID=2666263 RepID=A0ABW2JTV9_9ACTN
MTGAVPGGDGRGAVPGDERPGAVPGCEGPGAVPGRDGPGGRYSPAQLACVAELIGDRSRAKMLLTLADGRALPAGLLATASGISASTASAHLAKLVAGGLLRVESHGRHRYYRLASAETAQSLEVLAALSRRSLPANRREQRMRNLAWARTCYDHLAGKLGVAVMRALLDQGALSGGDGRFRPEAALHDRLSAPGRDVTYALTADGARLLAERIGLEPAPGRRPLIRYCVDWSEQEHHLAGALGAGLLDRFFALGWIRRPHGDRAVRLTRRGEHELPSALNVRLPRRD